MVLLLSGIPLHQQQQPGRDRLLCQLPGLVAGVFLTLLTPDLYTGFMWAHGSVWSLQDIKTHALT